MLKLLHTGDIHLDSPFSGVDSRTGEARRNELRATFTSMMTYARMNGADLILAAGDLFDGAYVTRETVTLLRREFEAFGKPVFIAPGNHDPAGPGSVWRRGLFSDNVHVFTEETLSSVELPELNAVVYGYGFVSNALTEAPAAGQRVADPSKINLLVGHADMVSLKPNDCPLTAAQLENFGADYAALGHIHNPPAPGPDGRWCYSGCLEPRGFDEIGPKGACMVEITKESGKETGRYIKRVRFARRRYEKEKLPVDGCRTALEVQEKIAAFVKENRYGEDVLLSLKLTGRIPGEVSLDPDALAAAVMASAGLYYLKVSDGTEPELSFERLEQDPTLRGEVYRRLKPSLESDDLRTREVAVRALRYAMNALEG